MAEQTSSAEHIRLAVEMLKEASNRVLDVFKVEINYVSGIIISMSDPVMVQTITLRVRFALNNVEMTTEIHLPKDELEAVISKARTGEYEPLKKVFADQIAKSIARELVNDRATGVIVSQLIRQK